MIEFKIDGQNLKVAQPFIVADTVDYLEGRIIFSRDWAGLDTIYVHFSRTYGSYNDNFTIELSPKDPYIRKSHHLNLGSGSWSIWIHGCKFDGEETILRITTNKVAISVLATGSLNGETFPEFPKSIVEQVLSRLDDVSKTVEELEEFGTRLGDADDLYTVNKDTVVDAVNEVYEMATAARGRADLANTKADHALEIADGAEQDSYEAKGDAQNALDFARQAQATANNAEQRSIDAIWQLASKQNTLVSGENIKTLNGKSILGSGNIEVEGGGGVSDVQINGTSILEDGVANIPLMGNNISGLIRFKDGYGLQMIENYLLVKGATNDQIDKRSSSRSPITAGSSLDYAVKVAMCDDKGAAWTEDEQKAAQQRLGILSVEEVLF